MKCPHCLVEFHAKTEWQWVGKDTEGHWFLEMYLCPNDKCGKRTIYLVMGEGAIRSDFGGVVRDVSSVKKRIMVRPKGSNRPPVPGELDPVLAEDYAEACLVLADSPKASAALSRRCLQNLLRDWVKVKPGNLADEIQQVIDGGTLPSHLVEEIDAIRHIGNFAAHPLKSEKTGEILPAEPAEAEWNLNVLEALFDFYFVQPALASRRRAALDEKLKEAGRKPMK